LSWASWAASIRHRLSWAASWACGLPPCFQCLCGFIVILVIYCIIFKKFIKNNNNE
jgi:hypothetical protein